MAEQITIQSVTANTPVDIYYCNALSASCVYVASVAVFPFTFDVPSPTADTDFVIKIVDSQSCVDGMTILITPTPTPSITPTNTLTPTFTPTTSLTPTLTITPTASIPGSPTPTPTLTMTPTATPIVICHNIGGSVHPTSALACNDAPTIGCLFTYISAAFSVPVNGVIVYQTNVNGTLYDPYDGQNLWTLMLFGGTPYAVQITPAGIISSFVAC